MAPPSNGKEPNNPHDALFRRTFSSVEHAAAELRALLPSELLARLNLATLRPYSGSYVDAELASSQSDLLFSVELQNRPGFLYLLFEHQSSVPPLMPFRILKYVVRILDQHVLSSGEGAEALPLPPPHRRAAHRTRARSRTHADALGAPRRAPSGACATRARTLGCGHPGASASRKRPGGADDDFPLSFAGRSRPDP